MDGTAFSCVCTLKTVEPDSLADKEIERCRLILTLPASGDAATLLESAFRGGDVASVIFTQSDLDERSFLGHLKELVALVQAHDCAALVAGDTRIAGRADADGYLVEDGIESLQDMTARFSPHKIVGYGGVRERHKALVAAETGLDFIFFGGLDKDIRPEPHKKNIALGQWWSQMIEIPCAVMAGNAISSALEVANCGAEFVVVGKAVFCGAVGPEESVKEINELLDEYGPNFAEE